MSEDRARAAAAAVSQERLWQRHMAMAAIGAIANHGVNRQALSAEDIRARALLLEWAGARGYQPAVDSIANPSRPRRGRRADRGGLAHGQPTGRRPLFADLAPAGMIFVPCKNGISHRPAEYARPEELAAGARVLAATLVALA